MPISATLAFHWVREEGGRKVRDPVERRGRRLGPNRNESEKGSGARRKEWWMDWVPCRTVVIARTRTGSQSRREPEPSRDKGNGQDSRRQQDRTTVVRDQWRDAECLLTEPQNHSWSVQPTECAKFNCERRIRLFPHKPGIFEQPWYRKRI